jgi:ketosteroid isomerase-like protein
MQDGTEAIANRFFAAIERGDLDGVRELYAPDVRVWHNVTGRTQTREENLRLLTFFASRVADRRYEVLGRDHFPGGFVQRHVLHGKLASGETVAAPVCLVVYVADGRIRELYEYLDPETVRAAFARPEASAPA